MGILGDLKNLKDLTREQILYAIFIPLSLIIPGATYLLAFNDKILLPSTLKLDFLTFVFLSAVFSFPFFLLGSLLAIKSFEKDILVYIHNNREMINGLSEEEGVDLIQKLTYDSMAFNIPIYTFLLFYLTLVSFYTTSVSSPFIIPRIITYFDLAKNEQTIFWSWAVAWTFFAFLYYKCKICLLKKENPGRWKDIELKINKWRAIYTIQTPAKKSTPKKSKKGNSKK
ncbi:MAG: hypothetical protein NTY73_04115 [Candidatus Micrarchaeota archaeon]|nr:hypothetical protein [Candidatus Micrarchaeota archaeon]